MVCVSAGSAAKIHGHAEKLIKCQSGMADSGLIIMIPVHGSSFVF
jgi:hypothetical protein